MRTILLLALAGCAAGAAEGPLVPQTPILASRCRVGASQTSLLVTEWSSAEKANLEAALHSGAVAVQFSGCELRLLPACRLPGQYYWQRTTAASEHIDIQNEAELYAKLPLGALSLGAELKKSGKLSVDTTIAGQVRLDSTQATLMPADPACADATHIINAMSVGAFTLTAGGEESTNANASYAGIGGSGSLSQKANVVRSAGVASTCASASDQSPASECASPVQVFLTPIPGKAEPEGPPGTVHADFVSTDSTHRWDVYVNDQATCTTPCSRWVDPSRPLFLKTREDSQKLDVKSLDVGLGPLQVAARPREDGRFVTGLTFTALGGLGVVTGISLMGVGCPGDSTTMCHAGEITLGAGAVVTAGALWGLLLPSLPKVYVQPLFGGGGAILGAGRF